MPRSSRAPLGPPIAIVTVIVGVIGGDLWHHRRGKPAMHEIDEQAEGMSWE